MMLTFSKALAKAKLRTRGMAAISVAVLAVSLTACGGASEPASQNAQDPQNAALKTVEPGKLNIVSTTGQIPISYVDKDGNSVGFGNDLLRHIAEKLNLEPVFTTDTPAGGLAGLKVGRYDIGSAAGVFLPERVEIYSTSIPWYSAPSYIVSKNDADYSNMSDLNGKTVGVVESTAQSRTIEEFPDINVQVFDSQTSELNALRAGQIDAVFLGGENALAITKEDSSLKLGAKVPSPVPSGWFGDKNNEALMDAIDEEIKAAIEDGTFMDLWNEHVDHPVDESILALYPSLNKS